MIQFVFACMELPSCINTFYRTCNLHNCIPIPMLRCKRCTRFRLYQLIGYSRDIRIPHLEELCQIPISEIDQYTVMGMQIGIPRRIKFYVKRTAILIQCIQTAILQRLRATNHLPIIRGINPGAKETIRDIERKNTQSTSYRLFS